METQELCQRILTTPLLWGDNRLKKRKPTGLDFVNKITMDALWIGRRWTSPCIGAELATIREGSAHFDTFQHYPYENQGAMSTNSLRVREVGRSFGSYGSFGSSRDLHGEGPFVDLFQKHEEMLISSSMFVQLLDKCIVEKDLAAGRETHSLIVRSGLESDTVLGSYLIRMFSSFSCLVEAKQVFSKLLKPNVYSWSAVITAHAKLGQEEQAINLYHQMQMSDVVPDGHVFVAVLKACSSIGALNQGKQKIGRAHV